MTEREETAVLRRGIRVDLIIAVCALLMSSLATAASWWQSRVVAEQLSSQVWPYVSISTTYEPESYSIQIDNDGLGPAIIRSAVLTVDGKPYADPARALRAVLSQGMGPGRSLSAHISGLSPGSVIRASGSVTLIRLSAPWISRELAANAPRIDFRVCYCSLLGKCWLTRARQTSDPQPLATCPDAGADQFHVAPGFKV